MYIRRTHTSNSATGERYTTHRLVQSERRGGRVRQVTLLNLGRHFALPPEAWPPCVRIDVASPWGVLCESGASWEPGPSRPREVTGKEPVGRLEGHLPRARREPAGSLIVREQSNGDNLFP